jgi:hypothetical protein
MIGEPDGPLGDAVQLEVFEYDRARLVRRRTSLAGAVAGVAVHFDHERDDEAFD